METPKSENPQTPSVAGGFLESITKQSAKEKLWNLFHMAMESEMMGDMGGIERANYAHFYKELSLLIDNLPEPAQLAEAA